MLLRDGLTALRAGRAAAAAAAAAGGGRRAAAAAAEADSLLRSAAARFAAAAAAAPDSAAAAGNCGNALLARAQLLLDTSATLDSAEAAAASLADAEELAVQAGRRFRAALAASPGDARALVAWGAALALRGRLMATAADDSETGDAESDADAMRADAERLYGAAAEKFAAAAAGSPGSAKGALAGWGEALLEAAVCVPRGEPRRAAQLARAVRRLEDALREEPEDAAAAAALRRADALLAAERDMA